MDEQRSRPSPGETGRPGGARLPEPPGARYGPPEETIGEAPASEPVLLRGLLVGLPAALAVVAAWFVTDGVLDLQAGLLVAALAAGWVIGYAVRYGAWYELPHPPREQVGLLAAALGGAAWLAGAYLGYVWSLLVLVGATQPLAERMRATPFGDYLAATFLPFGPLELALIALLAWRTAR
ncbi:MAG TPA: hypothetical protein VFK38_05915 [Candidatus Limnocylindrales bacterium]|nr:hypothetical protein [Candidatus Limnocylindrales bacterium]